MKKILIANRGEIALRIMRTARKMGIATVAVYSEVDRSSPHVRFADEAVCIGPAPSSESYLCGDKIIAEAKRLNVDAIHPGYGFLSENAAFAEAVSDGGMIFIGPKPHAIRVMGSKLAAKAALKDYDIPLVPGTDTAIRDVGNAKEIATQIGYPILIKASAGGGGKGMRVVYEQNHFQEQMERAMSEAQSAFGDSDVFVEKYITSPRHIEIQILADAHGNVVHLFERDCSIQRRHQKVMEEAPSAVLSPKIRSKIGEAAINVARACGYLSAGTVEFILDGNEKFYFLEMNTRLQVEHAVTEMVTGIDLVEQQIRIARGEKLSINQSSLKLNGHALELRIYAEDPENNFLPSIGTLESYDRPLGEGIRLDDGFEQGMDISIYYDPMIAKLIAHANTRSEAIQKMLLAIKRFNIKGIKTTLGFGAFVCQHPEFIDGNFDTHFVEKYFTAEAIQADRNDKIEVAAKVGLFHYLNQKSKLNMSRIAQTNWSNQNREKA